MAPDVIVPLVVRGLGRSEITLGTLSLVPEQGMLFPLALVLAQRAGERMSRAELIELVWPESDGAAGRHPMRQALYRLRKAGLPLDDDSDSVCIDPTMVDSDLSDALRHDWPYRAEPDVIARAADVLPGFTPAAQSRLAEWLEPLRARIAAQHRQATLHRISLARHEGRWSEVERWALACLQGDPLNEEATLARAEASAMTGAKNAALELLDTYLRDLGDRARQIGLPARMLRRRISELTDTTGRRVTATSAPFVGRHDLLALGQDRLQQAQRGEATAQWFVGPSGIGKSRLLREMARAARMAGWCVVLGGARPSYEDRPLAMLIELLPQLLELPGALGADPSALTLMRKTGRADTGEEPLEPEEARGRQYAVYLAWAELMDAVLGENPLVLYVDDAHWADPLTLLMFARFLEMRPAAKLAIVLSARRVPPRDDGAAQRLLAAPETRIAPLTEDEVRAFARSAGLAVNAQFDEVTRRLGAVSGGNPLFLGHLVHQHQTNREQSPMPSDLATLIDEQVRTLSRAAQRLLQACALLGRHASLPRVERVLGVEAPALVSPFGELDDMLALPSEPGQPLAPHDSWTERVRHSMTAGVLRSMAVSAARVLEADAQDDGGIEIYWDAARLYKESGEKQLAYATMMRCAEYFSRSGATLESCKAFSAAASFAVTPRTRYTALSGQLLGLHAMGEFAVAQPVVDELRALCAEYPEYPLSAEQEVSALEIAHYAGASNEICQELTLLASDESLSPECRLHAIRVGLTSADNFHDSESRASFSRCLQALVEEPEDTLYLLRAQIVDRTLAGSFESARNLAEKLLIESRRRSNRTSLLWDLRFCSTPSRRGGDARRALELLLEAQSIAAKFGFIYGQFRAADMRAGLLLDYQRLDEAKSALEEAQGLTADTLGAFARDSLDLTRAFWSLATGDWGDAKDRLAKLPALDTESRSRHAMLQAALDLRIATHEERREDAEKTLIHLLNRHADVFTFGGSDQIALAVFEALGRFRSQRVATEFARRYVHEQRQERFPPPPALRDS